MAENKMSYKGEWHNLSDPPKRSGYVLLAITHNNITHVVTGHYAKVADRFRQDVYYQNVQIDFWMELPEHPKGEEWKNG
jgi:hypothetical protein